MVKKWTGKHHLEHKVCSFKSKDVQWRILSSIGEYCVVPNKTCSLEASLTMSLEHPSCFPTMWLHDLSGNIKDRKMRVAHTEL